MSQSKGDNVAKQTGRRKTSQSKTARKSATKKSRTTTRQPARKSAAKKTAKRVTTAKGRTATKPAAKRRTATKAAKRKNAARAAATRTSPPTAPKQPSTTSSAATTVRGAVAGAVAAVAKRLPWGTSDQDAITLLETDHRRFESLLKRGQETTERAVNQRTELLNTLTVELNLHELVEEKILYPALKSHPEARDIVLEGYQEHHVADVLVSELHDLTTDDERWGAKFKVLKESLEHHIQEEEGEMFRTARGIFSREDLQALGAQMAKMKAAAQR